MQLYKSATLLLLLLAMATPAIAQGDLIARRVGYSVLGQADGFNSYGTSGGIAGYSIATQACNLGNVPLPWTSGTGQDHPVISMNVYRIKGHRFEHIGQSWVIHGFCALCEAGCGPQGPDGCATTLRVGCAFTHGQSINNGAGGGPKFTVDPTSGDHSHPDPNPVGPAEIRGHLQIHEVDVTPSLNQGARYVIEGHYVHYQDHQNGFAQNNVSWGMVQFANDANFTMSSASLAGAASESGLYAWKAHDPSVVIQPVVNTDEGGPNVHGLMEVASRTWDNGNGTWDYTYVVYNQNSTQGIGSFEVPTGSGVTLTNVWFNDVDYHSGEPQDGADWIMTQNAGNVTWTAPQTFAQNPNANAINWATAYSFGFTADGSPLAGSALLNMFEPGVGTSLTVPLDGPGNGVPVVGTLFCSGTLSCPCFGIAGAFEGCLNSAGTGAKLLGAGTASFSNDTLAFHLSGAPDNKPGLLLRADNRINNIVGDGILCVGGASHRSQVQITNGGATTFVDFNGASFSNVANAIGTSTNFQFWYRDPANPCTGAGFNFSNAVDVVYAP